MLTRSAEAGRTALVEEIKGKVAAWDENRASMEAELQHVRRDVESEKEQLESNLREKLSLEYELKLKDLSLQKDSLEQKLRDQPAPAANVGMGDAELQAELAHLDEQVAKITAFIEDPQSALANVIRKNVERSELEAYRRGLTYRGNKSK